MTSGFAGCFAACFAVVNLQRLVQHMAPESGVISRLSADPMNVQRFVSVVALALVAWLGWTFRHHEPGQRGRGSEDKEARVVEPSRRA